MKRAAFSALLAVTLAACAGPRSPLEVGMKEYPTEVLLGAQRTAVLPPPSLGPVVGFPGFVQPPPPRDSLPERPAPDCPDADPLDSPRLPATNRASRPPVVASYTFRNQGAFTIEGPNARQGRYPATTTRSIQNVQQSINEFTFEVAETLGDTTTTTIYRVVPETVVPPAIANPPDSGIFIIRVVSERPGEDPEFFAPTPGILILPFPAEPGLQWDARGIDPLTQTVMQFHGNVTGTTRVDACGVFLQAWNVVLTQGFISGPTKELTFKATYAIGTQFGGFSLYDNVEMSGVDGDDTLRSANLAVISSEPSEPQGGVEAE